MYCSGQLIHCLKISGNKNNLRTIRGWNRQNIKNSLASAESYWFFLKKACITNIVNVYINPLSDLEPKERKGMIRKYKQSKEDYNDLT